MSLHDETGFQTGLYTVTRTAEGVYDENTGRYTPGAVTTLEISADIQPEGGRLIDDVPETQGSRDERRTCFTSTKLYTREPGFEPDVVTIDGERWRVDGVIYYGVLSDPGHYRATLVRLEAP